MSLQYEPGRLVFSSLERTATDLAGLADGRLEELPPRYGDYAHPALAHLERALFEDVPPPAPDGEGAIRFLEGAGTRATLELVADEILQLLRGGTAPDEILVVCPSLERVRAPLESAFGALGVPYALDATLKISADARSATRCSRCSATRGSAAAAATCSASSARRTPGSAAPTPTSSRGACAAAASARPSGWRRRSSKLRGGPIPRARAPARGARPRSPAVRELAASMLRAAHGLDAPPATEAARLDLRAYQALLGLLDELEGWVELGGELSAEELVGALERAPVRTGSARPGHVAIVDLLRARTRRARGRVRARPRGGRLPAAHAELAVPRRRPPPRARRPRQAGEARPRVARPLPLLHGVHASVAPALPRARGGDRRRRAAPAEPVLGGRPRRAPAGRRARGGRAGVRSPSWSGRSRAPRASASGCARSRGSRPAMRKRRARSRSANGWERRLDRALAAFTRPTQLTEPGVLESLRSRSTFGATELEAFAGCSSIWFVERLLDPTSMDAEVDARMRGSIAHQALFSFFSGLPKRLGAEQVPADRLDEALEFLRECLDEAIAGGAESAARADRPPARRAAPGALARPRGARPRRGGVGAAARPAPLRGLVRLGALGARAPARPRPRHVPPLREDRPHRPRPVRGARDRLGLQVGEEGAQRDADRAGAEAPDPAVHARAARPRRRRAARRALPAALGRPQGARPAARVGARRTACPAARGTTTSTRTTSGRRSSGRRTPRGGSSSGSASGDVRHDPRGGSCPSWCRLGSMCRVQARVMAATVERPPTPEQDAAIEAEGLVFVSAGAGTGKTSVLVERFARAIDSGIDVALDPRHHLHRAGGRRAALADPRAARRARPARADPRARRRLDLDDPRLLPAAAQAVPVRRRARPALPRAGREPGGGAPGRGVRGGAGRVLRGRCSPSGSACSPPTARRRSGGC